MKKEEKRAYTVEKFQEFPAVGIYLLFAQACRCPISAETVPAPICPLYSAIVPARPTTPKRTQTLQYELHIFYTHDIRPCPDTI